MLAVMHGLGAEVVRMWAGLQAFPPEEACPPLVTSTLLRLAEPVGLGEGACATGGRRTP